jgi:hypothetical protein
LYDKLRTLPGFKPEVEEQIRKHGGFESIDLNALAAPGTAFRRLIDTKLVEKESLLDARKGALSNAGETRKVFLAEEKARHEAASKEGATRSLATFEQLSATIDLFKPVAAPANADAAAKTRIEQNNKFIAGKIAEARGYASATLSPEQQAELAAIYPLAHIYAAERPLMTKQIETLTTQLAEANQKIATFKKAGKTTSGDPRPAGDVKAPTPLLASAGEALDQHFGSQRG